jgi:hypothetical protein
MDIASDMKATLQAPFQGPIDLVHLFLLVGILIVMLAAWLFIIREIEYVTKG